MSYPVMDQSQLLRQPAMGHAGRPWLVHGPNSGFNSRDGGQALPPSPAVHGEARQ